MGSSSWKRCAIGSIAIVSGGWTLLPLAAAAQTGSATILHRSPGQACAGQVATLVWTSPEGASDLTGYRITQMLTTPSTPQSFTTDVGPEQTRLTFTLPFGLSTFQIQARTAAGVGDPYASASIMGNQAPKAMSSDRAGATVGDGTAVVPFKWYGPLTWSTTGGTIPTTLRVTSSTGASVTSAAPHDGLGVATSFAGLSNGSGHTFSAVTSNVCGSSASSVSPIYVPGVGPAWTQASPPLKVAKNTTYRYRFVASGSPAVSYRLVDAPPWLAIAPDGQVTGSPPPRTSSFSYSVVASNGVGIGSGLLNTDIVAGPFTVYHTRR